MGRIPSQLVGITWLDRETPRPGAQISENLECQTERSFGIPTINRFARTNSMMQADLARLKDDLYTLFEQLSN